MARRSAVHSGTEYAPADGTAAAAGPPDPVDARAGGGQGSRGSGGTRWGGAGGRWWVWAGRVVLWAFIIVVVVNGIRVPFQNFTDDSRATAAPDVAEPSKPTFPTSTASAYALQFADAYLNYNKATASARAKKLKAFLASGLDPQLGWNGTGKMRLQSADVASVHARDANHAVVTLLVTANDKVFRLAVPIYAKNGALAVSGPPARLAAPHKAALPTAGDSDRDSALEAELREPLAGFFKAYAAGDSAALQRFTDRPITGLGGAVTLDRVVRVVAPHGKAAAREVTVTVIWNVSPAQAKTSASGVEQAYRLGMVKKDGKWYVDDIQGSIAQPGS